MRASSRRRSSVVWILGIVGRPPQKFTLWSHFYSAPASLESAGVLVPASPAGVRMLPCMGCRRLHFGSRSLQEDCHRQGLACADLRAKRRGHVIGCTLASPPSINTLRTVLRSLDMFESSSHPTIGRRWALRLLRALCGSALFLLVHLPAANGQTQDHSTDALRKLNESVDALIKKVSPSVVQILVTGYGPLEESEHGNTNAVIGRQKAIGSGFVIDPSGYIVTNAHVVKGAQRVQVVLPSGDADGSVVAALSTRTTVLPARIVGVSSELDLAVLKVEAEKLPALALGTYRKLGQGEIVFAFGSPGGLRNTVTMGVVSAVARQTEPDSPMIYIQTDAPINPGNSGGPLVNADGEVVGVNTFILSQSGGNEGLGFAIPSNVVNIAFRQLRKFGHLHRAEIGIGIQTITPSMAAALSLPRTYGVVVSDVLPGSPAEAAGLQIGDVLGAVAGTPV